MKVPRYLIFIENQLVDMVWDSEDADILAQEYADENKKAVWVLERDTGEVYNYYPKEAIKYRP